MSTIRLASRYAKALIDLAEERGELSSVHGDINVLNDSLKSNRDLWLLLKSPIVTTDKKLAVIKGVFGDIFSGTTSAFVDLITKKRRETYLPEIAVSFLDQYKQRNAITSAKLTTATGLTDSLLEQVRDIVLQHTGKKQVELETTVDPSLIGGFILEFEDKLFDSTISHKLDKLKRGFKKNKYVREF